ncbi:MULTISPECIES: hypothetical protein [Chromohalobacter]|uniref:hypothetical protein n=1 Tax=Chromohalobacter TaxID=42054 RepID=UPI001FFC3D7D|nr:MULTISPECIES: hypothetical protein [Chromohalobacter]MCK2044453.1 hypothetical protein [Chromohalobacter moromii]MCT8467434.1 hypothetical protein [Chromohalobacter canadensis]MCT8470818.1 hypothetical protein [Chromohalobacter canadensis]MCT8497931.1 hypothetical protein [Chromohalobacter canadensis]
MQVRTLIAAVALAALPVAAQASLASAEAMQVNHESLQVSQGVDQTSVSFQQLDTSGADSVGIAKARHYISVHNTKQTDLPSDTQDQQRIGHRADW